MEVAGEPLALRYLRALRSENGLPELAPQVLFLGDVGSDADGASWSTRCICDRYPPIMDRTLRTIGQGDAIRLIVRLPCEHTLEGSVHPRLVLRHDRLDPIPVIVQEISNRPAPECLVGIAHVVDLPRSKVVHPNDHGQLGFDLLHDRSEFLEL